MPITKRTAINNYLSTFLEIGRFIQMSDKLKQWCQKMNIGRSQIPTRDMTEISSWPVLIATLVYLAEKAK